MTRRDVTDTSTAPQPGALGRHLPQALSELKQAQALQARWEASAASKQAELDDLERRTGDEVLAAEDAEEASERLTAQVVKLRTGVEADTRTAASAGVRVVAAKRKVLRSQADDLRADLVAAQQQKAEHDRKLSSLLTQLSEHDGARYVVWEPTRDDFDREGPGYSWAASRSDVLARPIVELEQRIDLLERAAAGQPVPRFGPRQDLIPVEMYSPYVYGPKALFPELVSNDPLAYTS